MRWYPVELHTHTCHSDGSFTVEELVDAAARNGYRALALTDHNTSSGVSRMAALAPQKGILPVRGLEWTTYHGHMVVLEENGYTDWRGVKPEEIDEAIRSIHRNGGIVGIAHPFSLSDPINTGYHWAFQIKDWSLPDYMEVWTRNYAPRRLQSVRAFEMWEKLLSEGHRITAMTGRDWHKDDGLPCCYTWVGCEGELTVPKLLDAIRGGHICLSAGPLLTMEAEVPGENGSGKEAISCGETFPADTKELTLHLNLQEEILPGIWDRTQVKSGEIRVIADGKVIACVPVEKNGTLQTRTLRVKAPEKWLRADLFGSYYGMEDCRIALTNPVFREEKPGL